MPARPSIKAMMRPTGPPPAMITALAFVWPTGLFGGYRGVGRHHFLHGAHPARMSEVEDDAIGVLVFDFVIGVRIVVDAAHIVGAAGGHHLPGRRIEIVDPHPEMNEAVVPGRETWDFTGELEQRDVDGAVGHVKPDAGTPGNRHAERVLKKFRGFFGVRNRDGDVAKTGGHGKLLFETPVRFGPEILPRLAGERRGGKSSLVERISKFESHCEQGWPKARSSRLPMPNPASPLQSDGEAPTDPLEPVAGYPGFERPAVHSSPGALDDARRLPLSLAQDTSRRRWFVAATRPMPRVRSQLISGKVVAQDVGEKRRESHGR